MLFRRFVFLLSLLVSANSVAEDAIVEAHHTSPSLSVSSEIKQLLTKEMLAIEQGMQALLHSIAIADWHTTITTAKQIQASYILKQSLTAEQKVALHHSLPKRFIEIDHSFHQFAGMLAHAAEAKNTEVVNFYFYKMTDSCVQCHSRYATEKFVGFKVDPHKGQH